MSITHKLEELLEGKGNRYRLAVIASRRARELNAGAPALIESEARKTTSLALEEVLRGKIKYERRIKPPPEKEEKKSPPPPEEKEVPKATKEKKGEKRSIPKGSLRKK